MKESQILEISKNVDTNSKDLSDSDYIKILLDNNYKEAINTWTRTGYLLVFNSVLFGFYINYIKNFDGIGNPEALAFCLLGIIVAISNATLVWVSVHYNKAWHNELIAFVKLKSDNTTGNWMRFYQHIEFHEKLPFPWVHTSAIAKFIAIVIIAAWSIALFFYVDRHYEIITNINTKSLGVHTHW